MNAVKTYYDAQAICDQIASEINLALKANDGYSRYFFIPNKISNVLDYNITVSNYLVILQWSDGLIQSVIFTKNITGNLTKGQNLIKNINGIVYVNQ
jgi:hypothetical protein